VRPRSSPIGKSGVPSVFPLKSAGRIWRFVRLLRGETSFDCPGRRGPSPGWISASLSPTAAGNHLPHAHARSVRLAPGGDAEEAGQAVSHRKRTLRQNDRGSNQSSKSQAGKAQSPKPKLQKSRTPISTMPLRLKVGLGFYWDLQFGFGFWELPCGFTP